MLPTKIACTAPRVSVANPRVNADAIIEASKQAAEAGCQFILFPELCLTGATCGDLFNMDALHKAAEEAVERIAAALSDTDICVVFGTPRLRKGVLQNCALALHRGETVAEAAKIVNNEESRWFKDGEGMAAFALTVNGGLIHAGIGFGRPKEAPVGVDILLCLDASPTFVGSYDMLLDDLRHTSSLTSAPVVYINAGFGESTTDFVYGGEGLVMRNQDILFTAPRFQIESSVHFVEIPEGKPAESTVFLSAGCLQSGFLPIKQPARNRFLQEALSIQTVALAKRFLHTRAQKLVLGVSGGLDSTLAMIVCAEALRVLNRPGKDLLTVTLPGYGTSGRTYQNARRLMELFGADAREISIKAACEQHFDDIGHDRRPDLTFENTQARERTQILLDLAGMHGGLVVGTGDMTELALGFATYNGDHMSSYGVNAGVPKTAARALVRFAAESGMYSEDINRVLLDVADTPISPELLPPLETGDIAQKTEEIVGPYELNDFFLYKFLSCSCSPESILEAAETCFDYTRDYLIAQLNSFHKRFFTQQFKRSCLPDGPQVFRVSLSPRDGFIMPSDADGMVWQL